MLNPPEHPERRHYLNSNQLPDKCDSFVYRIPGPSGTLYVIFMEDNAGEVVGVSINIGKAGTELSAWAYAMSHMLTRGLLNKSLTLPAILEEFSGITSDKQVVDRQLKIRSSIEALTIAIQRHQRTRTTRIMNEQPEKRAKFGDLPWRDQD